MIDSDFNDIRPYRDNEVKDVLSDLISSDGFEQGIGFMTGRPSGKLSSNELEFLKSRMRSVNSVSQFQKEIVIELMLKPMITRTIKEITSSGLENLDDNVPYIYISNHRDITLDPALLNYVLIEAGKDTVEIAFGDNLLINDFVSTLIRINKSFIVKRGLSITEQLNASIKLSRYIYHTYSSGNSIWIAQREGRAKDGNDITNPAVLRMLTLSTRDSGISVADFFKDVKIVPVSISYEYDPCDSMKALELFRKSTDPAYKKNKNEDLLSISKGISGKKGRVHYAFGSPIDDRCDSEKEMAVRLDTEIQSNYRLWPSNYIAYDLINNTREYSDNYDSTDEELFNKRIERLNQEVKRILLMSYANPLINKSIK